MRQLMPLSVLACAVLNAAFAPAAVLDDTAAARSLIEASPADAADRLSKLVQANPFNGRLVFDLGHACLRAKAFDDAITAFEKALDLGEQPPATMYNIACCHALAGRKSEAIAWLGKALDRRFVEDELLLSDPDLNSLRKEPEFLKLVGAPAPQLSREQQWQHDLDYLQRRMEQLHFNLYAKVPKETFTRELDSLKSSAARLTDEQVLTRLRRIIALVGDGHTRVVPADLVGGKSTVVRAPIDVYRFSDGLYVRSADSSQSELVGCRVLKFGNLTTDEAMKRAEPFVSVDNRMGYLKWTPILLTYASILREIGIVEPGADTLSLEVLREGRAHRVEVPLVDAPRPKMARFGIAGYVSAAKSASAEDLPLWLKHPDKHLWQEYLPQRNAVYFFFGQVMNQPNRPLAECFEELFKLIDEKDARCLIIDMRTNGGGNNFLLKPLLHGLIRREKLLHDRGIFVITSRSTYSAAVNGLGLLEWHLNPVFVGEPPAAGPCFVGEGNRIVLPCSGHAVTCSSRYWQQWASDDLRSWYAPAVAADLGFADFVEQRDPAMDAIYRELDAAHGR